MTATTTDPLLRTGYYCTRGASQKDPTDGVTGDICPTGAYCPEDSTSPTLCPAGSFNPGLGGPGLASCRPCTAGSYCHSAGQANATGLCSAGYYCPAGQLVPEPHAYGCPVGYRCPVGSPAPLLCRNGTYQDAPLQDDCKVCPEGFYCLLPDDGNVTVPLDCPRGYYCPFGTQFPNEWPCPPGTYSAAMSLVEVCPVSSHPVRVVCG